MYTARSEAGLARLRAMELAVCEIANRAIRLDGVRRFFALVSRLGDGIFWYAIVLALPLVYGQEALLACANMVTSGAVALLVYKLLKGKSARPRPYAVHAAIRAGVPPLDQYSFPSGHTLHAFCFTLTAIAYYPGLAWVMVPATVVVSASRLVLGLHYPSDVIAGALLGAVIAESLLYV